MDKQLKQNEFYLEIENIKDFNLDHIFDCGQCFRWQKEENGSYTGVITYFFEKNWIETAVNIDYKLYDDKKPKQGKVIITSNRETPKKFWHYYLDLSTDYGNIKRELTKADPKIMGKAIESGEGIRLLNQDKWETLISFIVSANNNIPRIKGCIESLCMNFGNSLGIFNGKERYSFPRCEKLASLKLEDLDVCKLGYRAKYILETSKEISTLGVEYLYEIEKMDQDKALKSIMMFKGVGPKVAHCISLFSLGKRECFPVDVWIKKVMEEMYDLKNKKEIEIFAESKFGKNRGIAQQYLFYHIRG